MGLASGLRAFEELRNLGYSMKEAQRLIDKGRLISQGKVVSEKNAVLTGEIYLIDYEPEAIGLEPIFECEEFAVFDKPSGVLSHPNGRHCEYSLCDEIWARYGREASVAHRLDFETSGLIVVARNGAAQTALKKSFESRAVSKIYVAMVHGRVEHELLIDAKMDAANDYDDLKMRMKICDDGKSAITRIEPVQYFADIDATFVRAIPLTGRQHQIRLHLFHVEHKILGEPLYGLHRSQVVRILDKEMPKIERLNLTGALRLLLHASEIKFEFGRQIYEIKSEFDAQSEFYQLAKNGGRFQ